MPILPEWYRDGLRVITPDGFGEVEERPKPQRESWLVRLDKPIAGQALATYEAGRITPDTPFCLARVLSVTGVGLVTSAMNYPTWEELLSVLKTWPYVQDETLLALNFETRKYSANRPLGLVGGYQILETSIDRHTVTAESVFETFEEAMGEWMLRIGRIDGTSGYLMLAIMLKQESVGAGAICARALFSTTEVLKREEFPR